MLEFLLDENVLGLDRYLKNHVNYRKIGDMNCPAKETPDPDVVKFAKENNLVLVTRDEKMVKQCKMEKVEFVTLNDEDFAKKIICYTITDSFD